MRVLFTWLFLLLSVCCRSQNTVTVSGIAFDTTSGRNRVQITLNDTLNKFWLHKTPNDWQQYFKLMKDSNCTVFAGKDGKFKIRGKKNDSLYFSSFRHITKAYRIGDLLKMKVITVNLKPEGYNPCYPCQDSLPAKLYVFVGEKIRLNSVPNSCIGSWDGEYAGEYRIIQNLHDSFPGDTIRFTGFTHGRLSLGQFQHVLLFVGEYCGKLYHEKYQFCDVYKTTSGRWASPGDPYRYDKVLQTKNLKAEPMTFIDSLSFDARTYGLGRGDIKDKFPEPYFRVEGNKVTPLMGTYVEDLIRLKKEGTLKSKLLSK